MINKKGISPVIATTLLILIAIIIALIIFWWIKAFVGESIQKDIGSGNESIENFCVADQLVYSANAILLPSRTDLQIDIQNSGNIPIQAIQVKKKGFASVKDIGYSNFSAGPVTSGYDDSVTIPANGVGVGENIRVVAVLLGTTTSGTPKEYSCANNYVEVEVTV